MSTTNFLHATRHGWSMAPRHRVVKASKYGHNGKGMAFLACDDGARICAACCGEINGRADEYGPVQKYGECYHCGLTVERY